MSDQAPEPGIYQQADEDNYRQWDAVNATLLMQVSKTPLHAWWYLQYGYDPTDAQELGTAAHMAFLEPQKYNETYVVLPDDHDGRTKEGKARKANIEQSGQKAINAKDHRMCEAIRRCVTQEPELQQVIQTQGYNEMAVTWESHGERCKAKIDRCVPSLGVSIDLKTTQSAKPEAFQYAIRKYAYDVQAWHYVEGQRANELPIEEHWLVAVEKSPPHVLTVFKFDMAALEACWRRRNEAFTTLQNCRALDSWPGYVTEPVTITPDEIGE